MVRQNGVCSDISGCGSFLMLPNLPFSLDGSSDEWHQDGVRVHAAGMCLFVQAAGIYVRGVMQA